MYGDSLPEERKKIISIYHSHQQSLEEIMYSKPSINTLPDLEQVEMMNRLLNGEVF